jgi:hypothetical protein
LWITGIWPRTNPVTTDASMMKDWYFSIEAIFTLQWLFRFKTQSIPDFGYYFFNFVFFKV